MGRVSDACSILLCISRIDIHTDYDMMTERWQTTTRSLGDAILFERNYPNEREKVKQRIADQAASNPQSWKREKLC